MWRWFLNACWCFNCSQLVLSRHKGSAYDMGIAPEAAVDALNLSRSGHKKITNGGEEVADTQQVAEGSNHSAEDNEQRA